MNKDFDGLVAHQYLFVRDSAKKGGLEFSLSLTSLRNVYRAKQCHFTGVALDWRGRDGDKISLDRVDATKGYVKGNVVACSQEFNSVKAVVEREKSKGREELIKRYKVQMKAFEKLVKRMEDN